MAKKQVPSPKKVPETPPPAPAIASAASECSNERLAALEKRLKYLEDLADIRERLNDDTRLTLVCLLEAIKKAQQTLGVSFMQKGTFYGVKF